MSPVTRAEAARATARFRAAGVAAGGLMSPSLAEVRQAWSGWYWRAPDRAAFAPVLEALDRVGR